MSLRRVSGESGSSRDAAGGFMERAHIRRVYIVLVASAVGVAACASSPPKSPDQARADAVTTERIYAALESNPIYYFRDVEVSVDYGVARLSGYVWTTDALYRAQEIVRRTPGVMGVKDEMQLEREGSRAGGDGTGSG
jgi:BON domain-containing protein